MIDRVGHQGELGRWLDLVPDVAVIARPNSAPVGRRLLLLAPAWLAVAWAVGLLGLGVIVGFVAS